MSAQNIKVQKKNNGIQKEGDLEEIAEFSKEMKCVLEEVCDEEEPVENFDSWRPRKEDNEEDIKHRTAAAASISEKEVENESEGIKEDFSEAKKELKREMELLNSQEGTDDVDHSENGFWVSVRKFFNPIASATLKLVREMEKRIYLFMLSFNPYYFDAEKFSVSLEKNRDDFEINFKSPEEEYRRTVKQKFGDEA